MMAARDLMFIRELFADLRAGVNGASTIYCDSKSAVAMAFDHVVFKQTKHILRAAEFLRDLVLRGVVHMQHLPGAVMVADLLTKPVARTVFVALIKLLDDYSATGVVCP